MSKRQIDPFFLYLSRYLTLASAAAPRVLDFSFDANPPTIVSTTVTNRCCRYSTPAGIPALPVPTPSISFPRGSKSNQGREDGQQSVRSVTGTYSNNTKISVGVTSIQFDAHIAVPVATAFQAQSVINHWRRPTRRASLSHPARLGSKQSLPVRRLVIHP
jgi:hypothetical protein